MATATTAPSTDEKRVSKISKRLQSIDLSSSVARDDQLDRGETAKEENRYVFETAWEVANKGNAYLLEKKIHWNLKPNFNRFKDLRYSQLIFSWWHLHCAKNKGSN